MLENVLSKRLSIRRAFTGGFVLLTGAAVALLPVQNAEAQQDSAAASGMTTGLPTATPAERAKMMHIRAQANAARPEAEAAAIQRSVEGELDRRSQDRILAEARETKAMKEKAARDLQFQRAANAYKGVSMNEIDAWKSSNGGVRVQQDVPHQFLSSAPTDASNVEEEKEGGLFKGVGNVAKSAVSWVPFIGKDKDEEAVEATMTSPSRAPEGNLMAEKEKDGFFKGLASKIPFVGKKKEDDYIAPPPPAPDPAFSPTVIATDPATGAPLAAPVAPQPVQPQEEKKGFFKGLFAGKKDDEFIPPPAPVPDPVVSPTVISTDPETGATVAAPQTVQPTMPVVVQPQLEEKKGFFKGLASNIPFIGKKDKPAPVVAPVPGTEADLAVTQPPIPNIPNIPEPNSTMAPEPLSGGSEFESGSLQVGAAAPGEEEKEGFFSKLPFIGKKKDKDQPASAGPGETPPTAVAATQQPGGDGWFGPQTADPNAPAAPAAVAATNPGVAPAPVEEDKPGMFSGIKNLFGGKKDKIEPPSIAASGPRSVDASLFPQDGDPEQMMADEKKGFNLPDINLPKLPKLTSTKGPEAPKAPEAKKVRSPVHEGGSDIYVVQGAAAQFLRFGDSALTSDNMTLQPGTVVRMTKVGDDWSSVELSNGAKGIVRNNSLRPAQSSEVPSGTFSQAGAGA